VGYVEQDLKIETDDVKDIMERINTKKAVGIDEVPGDIIKLIADRWSDLICDMVNGITESGRIPRSCKVARVILLKKPCKDPRSPNTYRPISIFPALSKVWEKCLKLFMERCMGKDPFHRRQYGFKRRSSTVDAITQVMKVADICKNKRQICVLVTLDVKNAFNTLTWESINKELASRELPMKMRRVINNYLPKGEL
jgi:hypothetical protein